MKKPDKVSKDNIVSFAKEQIIDSNVYECNKDLIAALWSDNKTKTKEDVNRMIDLYLKSEVK